MIRVSLGNVGSGKTACEVRELFLNKSNRKTYSNIITRKIKNNVTISPHMIIKKTPVRTIEHRSGDTTQVYDYNVNVDFWKSIKEPINVVLDEAHTIINSRRSMSKVNIVVTDWLALIRRILGSNESGYGELVFITQLTNRLDTIARDMATQVRHHVCHYLKMCIKCGYEWSEHSNFPEVLWICPKCNSNKIHKHNHSIEVKHFDSIKSYEAYNEFGMSSYYRHYFVNDIEKYFPFYNTLQWDNLLSQF